MYELIVIGCSWGGLQALATIVAALPENFVTPIVVAQHRMIESAGGLASAVGRRGSLPVRDAHDKEDIKHGIYLAPPDYHLLVEPGSFALSTDEAVQFARPSIDVLFESAAYSYADKLIAVILTGANEDGAAGIARVRDQGGFTVVQDPATAVRREMPDAALTAIRPHKVLPLEEIGPFLAELCSAAASPRGN